MNLGNVEFQVTEFTHGYLFAVSVSVGQGLLIVFTKKEISIGDVFSMLSKYRDRIASVLSNYIAVEVSATDEIRALFLSEQFENI